MAMAQFGSTNKRTGTGNGKKQNSGGLGLACLHAFFFF